MNDCCSNHGSHKNHESNVKGGLMDKKLVMWIIIGVMLVLMLFLTFKGGASTASTAVGAAKSAGSSAASYSGMVGGC